MKPADIGLIAEVRFTHDALSRGFSVSQPVGNQKGYDCVLESGGKCYRVQVRATEQVDPRCTKTKIYLVEMRGAPSHRRGKKVFESGGFDVLAVWLIPEQAWVMVAPSEIKIRSQLRIGTQWMRDDWSIFGARGRPTDVSQIDSVTPVRYRRRGKERAK